MIATESKPATLGSGVTLGGCAVLREIYDDGAFSLACWRCLADGPGLRSERAHARSVVAIGFSGASIVVHGRRRVQIDPALALVFRRGDPYSTAHPWGCACVGCDVGLPEDLFEELGGNDPSSCGPRACAVSPAIKVELLRLISKLEAGSSVDPLWAGEILLEIVQRALAPCSRRSRAVGRPATSELHRTIVGRTCALLVERYCEPLTISCLAREVGASAAHLQRIFRGEIGISIHDYVVRLRVLGALGRLLDGEGDLATVAYDFGFSSHSHLSTTFRRVLGQPPSLLREARATGQRLLRQVEAPLRSLRH